MGRRFWRDWIAANALGELLGLGVAVVIAVGVAQAHALPLAEEILIVTTAFLVIGATVAGAVIAWMLGRTPSALAD